MVEWTCTVEAVNESYIGDVQDLSELLLSRLGSHHGSVAFGDRRIVATFTVDARAWFCRQLRQLRERGTRRWMTSWRGPSSL